MMTDAIYGIDTLQRSAYELAQGARQAYSVAAQEADSLLGYVQRYSEFDVIAQEALNKNFGSLIAEKIMEK